MKTLSDLLKKSKKMPKPSKVDSLNTTQNTVQLQTNEIQNFDESIRSIKATLGNSSDLVVREFRIGKEQPIRSAIFYIDGLTDTKSINDFVIEPLLHNRIEVELGECNTIPQNNHFIHFLKESVLAVGDLHFVANIPIILTAILSGDTVLLVEDCTQGLTINMPEWQERGVTEPNSQTVVRGPREGFSENIRINSALIRRKIKDPNLWLESKQIGKVTKTNVALMYIKGIVNEGLLKEIHTRLDRIQIDGILESGYIEELIQDETYTPFPTIYHSERPDAIAANLLEGRVAILVDGTPFVLIVPALFINFFQAAEDYYQRADIGSLLRLLRFLGLFISLLGPSLYIAVTTYHQELLPTTLLISLASQREGVPFPAFIEAFVMEVTFEILREAGVRLPRSVGQAVSIVGALVIGQAAVEAGIISASMVIVVALTAISNFVFPSFNMAISIRILRFGMMFLAASFGLFGITVGIIAMVLHLNSLRSFGIPYLAPFSPFIAEDQKDSIFRVPWWGMFSRPRLLNQSNIRRERNPVTPKPSPDKQRS